MAEVRLEGVSHTFPGGAVAVDGVDLEAPDGAILVLVGPSGSGKSTLLRVVAGLERPTAGRVRIGGVDVTDLPPQRRDVAMVFQSYALYPHRTVRENLAFGLRMRRAPAAIIAERVEAAARMLGLEALLERRPAQLSGGQRQRVALGRAIVREPAAFLLDEPLSNLDPALRVQTRTELARLQRRLGATMIHVTHDQEEAMTLGDRVAVLRGGRVQQLAPPLELYRRPATAFVAGFIGSPAMNLIPYEAGSAWPAAAAPPRLPGGRGLLGIRPHDVEWVEAGAPGALDGVVERVEPLGADLLLHVALGPAAAEGAAADLRVAVRAEGSVAAGERVSVRLPPERIHWFDAERGERL